MVEVLEQEQRSAVANCGATVHAYKPIESARELTERNRNLLSKTTVPGAIEATRLYEKVAVTELEFARSSDHLLPIDSDHPTSRMKDMYVAKSLFGCTGYFCRGVQVSSKLLAATADQFLNLTLADVLDLDDQELAEYQAVVLDKLKLGQTVYVWDAAGDTLAVSRQSLYDTFPAAKYTRTSLEFGSESLDPMGRVWRLVLKSSANKPRKPRKPKPPQGQAISVDEIAELAQAIHREFLYGTFNGDSYAYNSAAACVRSLGEVLGRLEMISRKHSYRSLQVYWRFMSQATANLERTYAKYAEFYAFTAWLAEEVAVPSFGRNMKKYKKLVPSDGGYRFYGYSSKTLAGKVLKYRRPDPLFSVGYRTLAGIRPDTRSHEKLPTGRWVAKKNEPE